MIFERFTQALSLNDDKIMDEVCMLKMILLFIIPFHVSLARECQEDKSKDTAISDLSKTQQKMNERLCFSNTSKERRYSPTNCETKIACANLLNLSSRTGEAGDYTGLTEKTKLTEAYTNELLNKKLQKIIDLQKVIKNAKKLGVSIPVSCSGNLLDFKKTIDKDDELVCDSRMFSKMLNKHFNLSEEAENPLKNYGESNIPEDLSKYNICIIKMSSIKTEEELKLFKKNNKLCSEVDPILGFEKSKNDYYSLSVLKRFKNFQITNDSINKSDLGEIIKAFRIEKAKKILDENCGKDKIPTIQNICEGATHIYDFENLEKATKKGFNFPKLAFLNNLTIKTSLKEDLTLGYEKYKKAKASGFFGDKFLNPSEWLILIDSHRCKLGPNNYSEKISSDERNAILNNLLGKDKDTIDIRNAYKPEYKYNDKNNSLLGGAIIPSNTMGPLGIAPFAATNAASTSTADSSKLTSNASAPSVASIPTPNSTSIPVSATSATSVNHLTPVDDASLSPASTIPFDVIPNVKTVETKSPSVPSEQKLDKTSKVVSGQDITKSSKSDLDTKKEIDALKKQVEELSSTKEIQPSASSENLVSKVPSTKTETVESLNSDMPTQTVSGVADNTMVSRSVAPASEVAPVAATSSQKSSGSLAKNNTGINEASLVLFKVDGISDDKSSDAISSKITDNSKPFIIEDSKTGITYQIIPILDKDGKVVLDEVTKKPKFEKIKIDPKKLAKIAEKERKPASVDAPKDLPDAKRQSEKVDPTRYYQMRDSLNGAIKGQ